MTFRMDKTLRFWVDCSYEDKRYENANRTRAELIVEILREYERSGDAMRYLNVKGQIAWKTTPLMLQKLADRRTRGRGRYGGLVRDGGRRLSAEYSRALVRPPSRTAPPRTILFQRSAAGRSHPGTNCLGGVPDQPGSQRDLWIPQRRVRSGDVVDGRGSRHQPGAMGAATAGCRLANYRRTICDGDLVHG